MSYINNTSIDEINAESSEVTPLNSSLTACIEENTAIKIPPPEIQRVQNFKEEIKSACAKTSSSCGIYFC